MFQRQSRSPRDRFATVSLMPSQRSVPVTVTFNGKSVEFAISHELAELCARELPCSIRQDAGFAITDSELDGEIALELSGYIDAWPCSGRARTLAAENAAYLLAGMLSDCDWEQASQIELHLRATDRVACLDLMLVVV